MLTPVFERLLFGRRPRPIVRMRSETDSEANSGPPGITKAEWLSRFDKEKLRKEDVDHLVYDFLCLEGHRDAAESFKTEADLQSSLG